MADLRCTIISDFQDEEIAYLDYLDFKKEDGGVLTLDSWDSFCDRAFIGDATHWLFRTGSAFMFEDDREDEISLDDVDFSTLRPFRFTLFKCNANMDYVADFDKKSDYYIESLEYKKGDDWITLIKEGKYVAR